MSKFRIKVTSHVDVEAVTAGQAIAEYEKSRERTENNEWRFISDVLLINSAVEAVNPLHEPE